MPMRLVAVYQQRHVDVRRRLASVRGGGVFYVIFHVRRQLPSGGEVLRLEQEWELEVGG